MVTLTFVYKYSRQEILQLRRSPSVPDANLSESIKNINLCVVKDSSLNKKKRKRGRKGGIRRKLKNISDRVPRPTIILSNVRSLRSKIDELQANINYMREFRESCVFAFTETWLNSNIPDSGADK